MAVRDKELRAFLDEVAGLWPVAKGSLAHVRRPCVRVNCQACARGDKHPAWIFTFLQRGKRRCLYVPEALTPQVRQAIDNGRRVEEMLTQAGVDLIERDRQRRREGGAKP